MIQKIYEKSPLKYALVKGISSFSPSVMTKKTIHESRIDVLLKEMVQTENLSGRIADEIKADYLKLVSDARVKG